MNSINQPNSALRKFVFTGVAALLATFTQFGAHATPYASGISNNAGTISFYLNEGGANVTVVFEDNSTNATFNGVGTQTAGVKSFTLGAHTSYAIYVSKNGSGTPNMIAQRTGLSNIRGVDANKRPSSPYFGRVYVSQGTAGFWAHNSDLSQINTSVAALGRTWTGADSPYKLRILPDDSLAAAAYTAADSGVYLVPPDLSTFSVLLGPIGEVAGQNAGVHGSEMSAPVITGSIAGGDMTLYVVDGDYPPSQLDSILTYHINAGPLPWQTAPDVVGAQVNPGLSGIQFGFSSSLSKNPTTGYFYTSAGRANNSNPNLAVYDTDTTTILFDSRYNGNSADYFNTDVNGINYSSSVTTNVVRDSCVSPDGKYVVTIHTDNHLTIVQLTNGIPNLATIQRVVPTSFVGNGRGISWDAADNIYTTSSGEAAVQEWSLGLSGTAITTGSANGATGFTLNFSANSVSVVATTPNASQGGVNGAPGTPVPGVFTITRTNPGNDYTAPMTVNFTLGGTATNGVYTTSPSAGITPGVGGSVVIPGGQTSTTISIIPTTANVPRLQTTVNLQLTGGGYSVTPPSSDTVLIQNTSGNQLVASAGAPTMYKAFSNDFASLTITRLGDTNVSVTTAPFTYAGTAVSGTDFTPLPAVTFNPGDIVKTASISPLSGGLPPEHTVNPTYVGNKSVTVGLPTGSGYTIAGANSTTLTLIDNAYPSTPVLFSDPLTDPNDAANWGITFGSGDENNHPADYTVEFGYDLTANNPESGANGLIGLPPGGATNALRITCLKNISFSAAGGVNVYYTNQAFSGNYALRFNMNLVEGDNAFPVEGPLIGINHNGNETNWWLGSGSILNGGPWASDGVWYWIQAPPGGASGFGFAEFQEYTGAGGKLPNTGSTQLATASAANFTNVFKSAVFTAPGGASGGTPANNSPVSATPADNSWADVELKQINNLVTLTIDKTPILTYTNTTAFTNGYIMLGYDCPIQGAFNQYIGTPDASVYFANLRVVQLSAPAITSIVVTNGSAGNVVLTFNSVDGDDTVASFVVQSASVVTGPFTDVSPAAIITQNGTGQFQAVTAINGSARFYRIRHL